MKILKWIVGILAALLLLFYFVGMPYLREQTKKYSPERTAQYEAAGITLEVDYCSPSKKGRKIFGGLVPYDKVWRTGANEPTTFTTSGDILVGGKPLPAGTYSLWTVPGRNSWTIILNDEVPEWGVTLLSGGDNTTRDPDHDVVQVAAPALGLPRPVEDFTIEFDIISQEVVMRLAWDQTEVLVKITPDVG
ncbi:DUF2911 domain-containing protein [Robiginitalea sp. SC105]|uniref:DUF2911 domain-containing protein n=1 Tax=Robiginitalea sp. SC105 TaxID=2762332 RepID=UPI00163A0EBE|nr:DUF2911 domain-containing protein [Robiginitalea sp. SC105]MBC2839982.1 DUF2911 domain-containing protein [Robiginitalea sp. SC105]